MTIARTRQKTRGKRVQQRQERRSAFPEVAPRATKVARGITSTATTPLHIRGLDVELSADDRAFIRERVGFRLGRFGLWITRISVRLEDVAGPIGAPRIECRVKVVVRDAPDVVLSAGAANWRTAFLQAMAATEEAVRRLRGKGKATRRSTS